MDEFYCENCNELVDEEYRDKYGEYYHCLKCGYFKGFIQLRN